MSSLLSRSSIWPMKRWIRRTSAGLVVLHLIGGDPGAAARPPSPPHLKAPREILSGTLPRACSDAVPDGEGNLWCSDASQRRIIKISLDTKKTDLLEAPGLFPEGLEGPGLLSLQGDRLAVDDQSQSIEIVDVKAKRHLRTLPFETLHGEFRINPSQGFALWEDRILFAGLGFQGPPPSFDRPAQALTLFTTGLDGRDMRILKRETLSAVDRPGRTLFGFGFTAPLPRDGMAVCWALPGKLLALRHGAKHLDEVAVPGLDVPAVPRDVLAREDLQAETLAATPHVAGLFTCKNWIGVVIQRPSPSGPRLSVSWFTTDLVQVREEGVDLPQPMTKWDFVVRAASISPGEVLFLIRHREPGASPSARLYKSPVEW